jgi:hypothetical protein
MKRESQNKVFEHEHRRKHMRGRLRLFGRVSQNGRENMGRN